MGILGPLEISFEGTLIPLPSRAERAVVASLAVRVGRPVAWEPLATDVWGDTLASGWRRNLSVTVSRLRRRLEGAAGDAGRVLILTVADGYQMDVHPDQVDAARFERLVTGGRDLLLDGRLGEAGEVLVEALHLWRGEPLPEIADARTGQSESARLIELHEMAIDVWNDATLAAGDHDAIVGRLEVGLRDAPLRERRWAQLMLALYRAGRQSEALRAFQRARQVLGEQLGLEPGPELCRMEAAILRHDQALEHTGVGPSDEPHERAVAAPSSIGPLEWVDRQMEIPLVGRQAERERLLGHWEHLTQIRKGGVVFIEGDAGVGKTRLAAEIASALGAEGTRVFAGRCAPGAGLSALVPATAATGVARPEGELRPGSPAVFEFGIEVANQVVGDSFVQPTLVILDDAQWADAQMISLFRQMGDRPLPLRQPLTMLTLILTQRGFEPPPGMAELIRDIGRLDLSDRIVLEPVGADEARALLVERLGPDLASVLAPALDALVQETGGNPRYLVEYARHLAGPGRQPSSAVVADVAGGRSPGVDAWGIPETVRVALGERLSATTPDLVRLLSAASVVGVHFGLAELATAGGIDEETVLGELEEAVRCRLIDEAPDEPGAFQFVNTVERQVVLDQLSSTRRARILARLGRSR